MSNPKIGYSSGITLIELMIVIVVAAILLTLAVPSFQEIQKRNSIVGQNNEIVALIHLARNEAIRRNPQAGPVTVFLTSDSGGWEGAVIIPGATAEAGCPTSAIRCTSQRAATLVLPTEPDPLELYFDNRGYSVDEDGAPDEQIIDLIHQACENNSHARRIRVLPAGQVSSVRIPCS